MSRYQLFGRCLESDLPFPELTPVVEPADWVLSTVFSDRAEPPAGSVYLGDDSVQGDIRVRLFQTPAGFWLDFDDSGCFEVTDDGHAICWYRPSTGYGEVNVDAAARIDVQGRVLALALHAEGRLCLHGSGVCTDGAALGFLAPKFHGKSTLALALVSAGARLITDDTLVVEPSATPLALPGVHAMRLWDDSARLLLNDRSSASSGAQLGRIPDAVLGSTILSNPDSTVDDSMGAIFADHDKLCLRDIPAARRMQEPAPLAAIYLLAPLLATANQKQPAASRTLLSPTSAALALVGHGKLTPLLGRTHAAVALHRAIDIARVVPVYTLSIVRDFARLDEVVEQLLAWHGDPVAKPTVVPTRDVALPSVSSSQLVGR